MKNTSEILIFIALLTFFSTSQAQEKVSIARKDSALLKEYFIRANEQHIQNNPKEESRFLDQIAFLYWEHNYFEEAIKYYEKSSLLNDKLGNASGASMINSNLGMLFSDVKQYQKSLTYFQKTLDYRRMVHDKLGVVNASINMSVVLNNLKQYDKSIERLDEALKIAREANDIEMIKSCYGMLAETFEKAGDTEKTMHYFELYKTFHEKLQKDKEFKSKQEVKETQLLLQLSEAEKKNKELELAIKNADLKQTKEELSIATDSTKQLYKNLSNAELQNELLNRDNQLKDFNIKQQAEQQQRQNIYILFLTLILFIIILFLIFAIRANKQKKQTNKLLETQKKEIENQASELQNTNQKLIELDKFKEGMNGMIVHDIKNPLNTILAYSKAPAVIQAAKQILNMVLNILDIQKMESTKINLNYAHINSLKLTNDALTEVEELYKRKAINIEKEIPHNLTFIADQEIIKRVIVNFLTNAIKYTPNNGKINISVTSKDGTIKYYITDTGPGINTAFQEKIFDKFSQINAQKSGDAASTGIGLSFCKLALEAHNQKTGVISTPPNGATFWFTLQESNQKKPISSTEKTELQAKNTPQQLSPEEASKLSEQLNKLSKLTVFEFSKIKTILHEISEQNQNISNWKKELENAVRSCNETKYEDLINNNPA